MSEQGPLLGIHPELNADQQLEATQFFHRHVATSPEFQEGYHERAVEWWIEMEAGQGKPLWLRRNFDDTSEEAFMVDCFVPVQGDSNFCIGSLEFENSGGQKRVSVYVTGDANQPEFVGDFQWDIVGIAKALELFDSYTGKS